MMTTDSADRSMPQGGARSVDELFRDSEPLHTAEDLASGGVFEDGEVDDFLADLYAMRRADLA